jgi:hypothetical protein
MARGIAVMNAGIQVQHVRLQMAGITAVLYIALLSLSNTLFMIFGSVCSCFLWHTDHLHGRACVTICFSHSGCFNFWTFYDKVCI